MSRDRISSLLLALCPLGIVLAACSGANGDSSETTSNAALTSACGPLQTRECTASVGGGGSSGAKLSSLDPLGGGVLCACVPVTGTPDPTVNGPICTASSPVPVPNALAGLGCTVGVSCEAAIAAAIWACPAGVTVPNTMGILPACPTPVRDYDCEVVSSGTRSPSPSVGAPDFGWILVEDVIEPGHNPVHCPAGCGGL